MYHRFAAKCIFDIIICFSPAGYYYYRGKKKWKKYCYYYSIIWEDDGTFFFGLLKNKPFESFRLLQRQQLIKVWKQSVFKCYVLVSLFPLGKILSSCFVRCSETAAAEKKGDLCDFFFFFVQENVQEGRPFLSYLSSSYQINSQSSRIPHVVHNNVHNLTK